MYPADQMDPTTRPRVAAPAPAAGRARRAVATALLLGLAAAAGGVTPGVARADRPTDDERARHSDLQTAKAATARFHDVAVALEEGYLPTSHCEQGPTGAMGYHYLKPEHVDATDPTMPAVLLYAPDGKGGVRLAGAEWFVVDLDQDLETDEDRPSMFGGQPFDGPMLGHEPGMPIHYDLHVWLWKKNPAGVFAQWNAAFSC